MRRFSEILDKVEEYHPHADLALIEKAYIFTAKVHQGQVRLSGEPYLSHPLEVAGLLADMKLDVASIAAGLLHDTIEDTKASLDDIRNMFGPEVANIVDGETAISRINFSSYAEHQAEYMRKMILAMATDIRVILVKLADRLHNMRTLGYLPQSRQIPIAQETLEIYAPLASRLGIYKVQSELEDLSLFYLEPKVYEEVLSGITRQRGERERYIREFIEVIQPKMEEFNVSCQIEGRPKHLYSIYRKMMEQDLTINQVYDVTACRIIVDSVKDCYAALGVIHLILKPIPGRFKDYISLPKENGYQSLHTTVIGPHGERMEVQIRTQEMHLFAENGIAAHWRYKDGSQSTETESERFVWLRSLLEWIKELKDPTEFLTSLKEDLFRYEVYVFTPAGDVKELPQGATPVDFAYSIHTEVGHRCTGAKINGAIVPLKYQLRNGDTVEILTSKHHAPSKDWLNFVITPKARNRIRQWFRIEERTRSISLGREMIEKAFRRHELSFNQLLKTEELDRVAREYSLNGYEDLLVAVGFGKITVNQVVGKFKTVEEKAPSLVGRVVQAMRKKPHEGIKVRGMDDILIRFAGCCNPLPGEDIIGFISQGRGVTVHSANCKNMMQTDPERRIEVEWDMDDSNGQITYPVHIQVVNREQKGGLAELSGAIAEENANISQAKVEITPDNKGISDFTIHVTDKDHLRRVIQQLKGLKNVQRVTRLR
ncbi:MAG: bifunctional (p)ppGpp synthetase/guanosine-3',5'-bis(diphosphate) 3'-pyrophosphohydrolase [Deltaproteobacteria bacterium]|nr:bifunctional (p)ppGpp synthetase/guanosine-3',5'-bis(diphosphate) 3'-pyrophosphohydrolase [Deltaproteobacteria bacterium]